MILNTLYDNGTAGLKIDADRGDLWFFFSFYRGGTPLFKMNMPFEAAKEYADMSKKIIGEISPRYTFGVSAWVKEEG